MRDALATIGENPDFLQCVTEANMDLVAEAMKRCDLIMATGGPAMTKAAHSSGKPAYCSGAGNATMIFDETTDVKQAAMNTRISKTSDFGSGCSADGNLIISDQVYDDMLAALEAEGGYHANGRRARSDKESYVG